jgi:hypothetical protein
MSNYKVKGFLSNDVSDTLLLKLLQSMWRQAWTAGIQASWKHWIERRRFYGNALKPVSRTFSWSPASMLFSNHKTDLGFRNNHLQIAILSVQCNAL